LPCHPPQLVESAVPGGTRPLNPQRQTPLPRPAPPRPNAANRVTTDAIDEQVRLFVAIPHIEPRRNQVSTAQATSHKAAVRRFCDASNTGDAELISKTIDDLVAPDALIRTPLPIETTGAGTR
jgi:hypothetical protein